MADPTLAPETYVDQPGLSVKSPARETCVDRPGLSVKSPARETCVDRPGLSVKSSAPETCVDRPGLSAKSSAPETCVDRPGLSAKSPAPEFEQEGRLELIKQISESTGVTEIDSVTWAFLWLADMNKLELVARYAKNPETSFIYSGFLMRDYYPALRDWLRKFRNTNNDKRKEPSVEGESSTTRSAKAADDTANRDRHKCIITKAGEPLHITHLISFALGVRHQRKTERKKFWDILSCFWSADKIERWQSAVFKNGTETPKNLLCMCANAHYLWDTARFVLRPVKRTTTELELEFYWLPDALRKEVGPCDKPIIGHYAASPKNCVLYDSDIHELIKSGHAIKMTTPDPEGLPLPSFELLEMQWYLHRVAAISGAADFVEDSDDDDDDDELEDMRLVERPTTPGVVGRTATIQPTWSHVSDSALGQQENQRTMSSPRTRQQSPGKKRDTSSTRSSPVRRVLE